MLVKKRFKQLTFIITVITLLPMMFFPSSAFANLTEMGYSASVSSSSEDEGRFMIRELVESKEIQAETKNKKYKINIPLSEERGFPIYGSPSGDTKYVKSATINGITIENRTEHRYLGYSYNEQLITNPWFPHDRESNSKLGKVWAREP